MNHLNSTASNTRSARYGYRIVTAQLGYFRRFIVGMMLALAAVMISLSPARAADSVLSQYLPQLTAEALVPGATGFGAMHDSLPIIDVMGPDGKMGYAYIASDFVGTTGYSGKPIHVAVAVDNSAHIIGIQLVKHSEPIVLIGIPEAKITKMMTDYVGMDLVAEASAGGSAHDLNIISGATVTIMVIDDAIVRSGLKVSRALGLGGLVDEVVAGPQFTLKTDAVAAEDWFTLEGDGTIRRLSLDVAQINEAFAADPDPRAAERALTEAGDTTFIDMYGALVSVPAIGEVLLGERENANLVNWLEPGDHAILLAARGLYSYKGSGYVRGGIFDRIQLIQDDVSVRFRDRGNKRLNAIYADAAPEFAELDLFKIPADSGFDPTKPFRVQLLVQREVAAIQRVFTTFDLGYQLPNIYMDSIAPPAAASQANADASEAAAANALWQRIWRDKIPQIAALSIMLAVLTFAFFFQSFVTRSERFTKWFRIGFLSVTLVYLGWYANAQLSIVNLMALANAMQGDFTWSAFLMDPLTFILWFSVAAALLFWGRGAYCGWLCPFGALQELSNKIARYFKVPQYTLPWGLHERLWPIKYIIFLGLFGVTLASLDQAERLAEVEPFKTAIILKFDRAWPFTLYALVLLGMGLFIERFYCRYLCPLGAGLAIPARIRMFDWLKRYRDCGNPCQTCARECMVQAIHPTGEINPNECLNCMHCQVLYQSKSKCPVVIKQLKRRETASGAARSLDKIVIPAKAD